MDESSDKSSESKVLGPRLSFPTLIPYNVGVLPPVDGNLVCLFPNCVGWTERATCDVSGLVGGELSVRAGR